MFTKKDLKQGDLIVYGKDSQYGVRKVVRDVVCNHVDGLYTFINNFNSDLTHNSIKGLNIEKVYRPKEKIYLSTMDIKDCDLVWEREEPKITLTLEEIAKKFGCDVKKIRIKD